MILILVKCISRQVKTRETAADIDTVDKLPPEIIKTDGRSSLKVLYNNCIIEIFKGAGVPCPITDES